MSAARRLWRVLIVSFVPFTIKSVDYLLIGSAVPGLVLLAFALLIGLSARRGAVALRRAIRGWSIILTLWALARAALPILYHVSDLREAHLLAQFTPWYLFVTLLHLVLGVYLYRSAAVLRGDRATTP